MGVYLIGVQLLGNQRMGVNRLFVVRAEFNATATGFPASRTVDRMPSRTVMWPFPPPGFFGLESVTNAAATTCTLDLAWSPATAYCGGSAEYSVYRSTTSGSGYALVAGGLTASAHVDTGLTNGVTYYYVVTAVDASNNESGWSNEASATPADTAARSVVMSPPGVGAMVPPRTGVRRVDGGRLEAPARMTTLLSAGGHAVAGRQRTTAAALGGGGGERLRAVRS